MDKLVVSALVSSVLLVGRIAGAQTAKAAGADTPVRAEATITSPVIATLDQGDPIDVIESRGEWYRVRIQGGDGKARVGYVAAHLVVDGDGSIETSPSTDGVQTTPPPQTTAPAPAAPSSTTAASSPTPSSIAPTLEQMNAQRDRREHEAELKARVDELQADLARIQSGDTRPRPSSTRQRHFLPDDRVRQGIWVNGGIALGSLGCDACVDRSNGGSAGLSVGATVNDRLLVGVATTGYHRSEGETSMTAATFDAVVRFYPARASGFFVTGGVGIGSISAAIVGYGTGTQTGVGMLFGAGWDVPIWRNLSLTPFYSGFAVKASNASANVGQFGVGVTFHRWQQVR